MRPDLGHSHNCLPFLKPAVGRSPVLGSLKDRIWDFAAIPDVLAARRLSAGADAEIIAESRHRKLKAGPNIAGLRS